MSQLGLGIVETGGRSRSGSFVFSSGDFLISASEAVCVRYEWRCGRLLAAKHGY
jgi:hypothetical protein